MLVNIHGPYLDHPYVFKSIDTNLRNAAFDLLLREGDLNFVWIVDFDKSRTTSMSVLLCLGALTLMINLTFGGIVTHTRRYSWHSNIEKRHKLSYYL